MAELTGTEVVVGITGLCPYGIGACWGGANEALRRLERVAHVVPVPDAEASTATVFLTDDGVPPLRRWREQFVSVVNGSYRLRGVEVTLTGSIAVHDHGAFLQLDGAAGPQQLRLVADPAGGQRPAQFGADRPPAARTGRGRRLPGVPDRSRGVPGPSADDHHRNLAAGRVRAGAGSSPLSGCALVSRPDRHGGVVSVILDNLLLTRSVCVHQIQRGLTAFFGTAPEGDLRAVR